MRGGGGGRHKRNKTKEKRTILFFILDEYVQWRGKSNSRERKSNFSLDFPVSESSDLFGSRSKVVLRGKGYAWAPIFGSFDKLREGKSFLLLDLIHF